MEISASLYVPESAERLDNAIFDAAKIVMETDDVDALQDLFNLLDGYAVHLEDGMLEVGFDAEEAESQAWSTTWESLRRVLAGRTPVISELGGYIERNLSTIYPYQEFDGAGEPLDAITRSFYRTFINHLEHPAIRQTAGWLFAHD